MRSQYIYSVVWSLGLTWPYAPVFAKSDIEIEKEERVIADMVHAIDAELAQDEEARRQSRPSEPQPSMLDNWLRRHLIGVSVASNFELGALEFKADDESPEGESPPEGCKRTDGQLSCMTLAANGGTDALGIEVDEPYVRRGPFLLDTGVSPKLHYQYAAPIDRTGLQDGEEANDVHFGVQNMMAVSGVFYVRTGILPRRLPDFLVTAYAGPRLGVGFIDTQVGAVTLALVSLQSGLDFALIPFVMDAAYAGGFVAVEAGSNLGSYVFSGPDIRDVDSANIRVAAGARVLFSLQ